MAARIRGRGQTAFRQCLQVSKRNQNRPTRPPSAASWSTELFSNQPIPGAR